jgi:epoxyqueuosine reductase
MTPTERIVARARELGFDAVGIATLAPLDAQARYAAWIAAGRHGTMRWLGEPKHLRRRADPTLLLRGLRSVVCVAVAYPPTTDPARDARLGRIARYAGGEDYHRFMEDRMLPLERDVMAILPGARALWYADTGAILERGWAERAGLGWIGKHSGLLSASLGSWLLLGEVLVDRELEPTAPLARERCGTCTRCITACPTGAIVAPYQVDARACISYLTIEHKGPLPRELRPSMGDWIFGCDLCLDACPWNRFAAPAREARLHAKAYEGWSLERFLTLDEDTFRALFADSAIRRADREGFVRNVCVALANRGDARAVPALARTLASDPAPLVRGHAAWALGELAARGASDAETRAAMVTALREAEARDADASVRDEAAAALARAAG